MRDYKHCLPPICFFNTEPPQGHKLRDRSSRPISALVGARVYVYTGKEFKQFLIKAEIVGRALGSFVITKLTGSGIHRRKKKKKSEQTKLFIPYGYEQIFFDKTRARAQLAS